MKSIIHLVLAIYFATSVRGQSCCAPKQWEGLVYGKTQYKISDVAGEKLSYDAEKQRMVFSGEHLKGGEMSKFMTIYDFVKKRRYFILPDDKECQITKLTGNFRPFCVPGKAVLKETSVGVNEILMVKEYTYPFNHSGVDVTSYFVVTEDCIPISFNVHGTIQNEPYFEFLNYFQITLGIADDDIFSPPDYCDKDCDE